MKQVLFCLIIILLNDEAYTQLEFKRDDFVGSIERRWWKWHNDPEEVPGIAITDVQNGFVSFTLTDAIINENSPGYCDAALWDGYPIVGGPYQYVKVKLRARETTTTQNGTIGWGLWYTEGNDFSVSEHLWFMQSTDNTGQTNENWWRASKTNGLNLSSRVYVNLDEMASPIYNEDWHTYEIDRQPTYIDMLIDGQSILYQENDLPENRMAFHIWADNLIYQYTGSSINVYQRSWTGTHQIYLDYVQIHPNGTSQDKSITPDGIILLRQVPNDIFGLETSQLWKNYSFSSSSGGHFVFLITGRAEYYNGESTANIDDDLRFVFDNNDYGWNTDDSFNPETEGTIDKTMIFEQNVSAGIKEIKVYAETSPLLYDVTVLGSATGSVIFDQQYNQTKSSQAPELWKEIIFNTTGGEVAVYVSGTADEYAYPSDYGYRSSNFNDNFDDDLKIVLDDTDYGYRTESSLYGNRLFGDPKSILVKETLPAGQHTLRLYGLRTPTLYRVVIYGNSTDDPLPVSLSSFTGTVLANSNSLKWVTESELNNFGYNIYRAESSEMKENENLYFKKINDQIIPGMGNSSSRRIYSFVDSEVKDNNYYWYQLEDIDLQGVKTQHEIIKLFRNKNIIEDFIVYNNYPNPFNGITKIKFYLKNDLKVQVAYYNTKGQLIEKKEPKVYPEGVNIISWDSGHLSTGIYYCKVSSDKTTHTIKMLVIK